MEQILIQPIDSQPQIKPTVIRNILLLSPGRWNDVDYTELEIQKAFHNTDWNDRKFTSLYLDHQDTKDRGVGNWVGYIKNQRLENSLLYGDLEVWNPMIAAYLSQAKAKFGVSATLAGHENKRLGKMEDFHFESFSIVTDPACKPAMINLSDKSVNMVQNSDIKIVTMENEVPENLIELESIKHEQRRENIESVGDKGNFCSALKSAMVDEKKAPGDYENLKSLTDDEEVKKTIDGIIADERKHYALLENIESKKELSELAKVTAFEEIRKEKGMSVSEFYAVPRDPPSSSSLPIFDAAHVRNAIARFSQTHLSPEEKSSVWTKIKRAASKFDIKVKENEIENSSGSEIPINTLEPIKYEKLDAKFERQVQHIKDSLRKSHPDWDEKKIEQVAYATANKMKEENSLSEENQISASVQAEKSESGTSKENSENIQMKGGLKPEKMENNSVTELEEAKKIKLEEAKKNLEEATKVYEELKKQMEKPEDKPEDKKPEDKKEEPKEKDEKEILQEVEKMNEKLLAAIESKIALKFKELDEMQGKVKELSVKVSLPDRKTLAFDSASTSSDSNKGMLNFLQHRID
jgi:rubrerythrin